MALLKRLRLIFVIMILLVLSSFAFSVWYNPLTWFSSEGEISLINKSDVGIIKLGSSGWKRINITEESDYNSDGIPDVLTNFKVIDDNTIEVYANDTRETGGYKWSSAICNISGISSIQKEEYNPSTGAWTNTGELNYGELWGLPDSWCDNHKGFSLFGSGSGDKRYRLIFPEGEKQIKVFTGKGSEEVVYTYQEENMLEYFSEESFINGTNEEIYYRNVSIANITLNKYDNTTVDDLFVYYNEDSLKFGANDSSNNNLEKYYYEIEGYTNWEHFRNYEYFLGEGNNKRIFNFKDICEKDLINKTNNESVNANCSFSLNGNILEVSFLSDYNIDPEIYLGFDDYYSTALTNNTQRFANTSILDVDASNEPYDNLVGYWAFDSDNKFAFEQGVINDSIYLDGDGDYIKTSNSAELSGLNNFTVSLWIKPVQNGYAFPEVIGKGAGITGTREWDFLILNSTSQLRWRIFDDSAGTNNFVEYPVSYNEWTLITGTYDGSDLKLYYDGSLVNSTTSSIVVESLNAAIKIGSPESLNQFYEGNIDEVMIFNRSLSSTEITELYNNQSTNKKAFENDADLVAYWDMDTSFRDSKGENNGVPFGDLQPINSYDWSGNSNTGTYEGNAYADSGLYGDSGEFDGVDDFVNCGNGDLQITGDMTISGWFYPNNLVNHYPVSSWSNTNKSFYIGFFSDDLIMRSGDGGTGESTLLRYSGVSANSWIYATYVRNGNNLEMYVNGSLVNSTDITGYLGGGDADIYLGGFSTGLGDYNGSIDEVMIFNRSLNSTEISDIYNNQSARFKETGNVTIKKQTLNETGYNRVNLTASFTSILSSNISARVGYWNNETGYFNSDFDGKNGLVGYYHADGNADDSSGLNHDGTLNGNANADAVGIYDRTFEFDGNQDYVEIPANSDQSNLGPMTVSVWAYAKGTRSGNIYATDKDDNNGFGRIVRVFGGRPDMLIDTSATQIRRSWGDTVPEGWHHYVFTWEGGLDAGGITLYVDGKTPDSYSVTQNGTGTIETDSSKKKYIGIRPRAGYLDAEFNGTIDEVMIFNRTLSEQEVKELYVKGRANWTYTDYQQLTSYEPETFNISINSTNILPDFKLDAGTDNFYTPVLYGDVNLTYFNVSEIPVDNIYPVFYNYSDNNGTLEDSGTGTFNVNVNNTNGTVYLHINGETILAENLSGNNYNATYEFTSAGTYTYNWTSFGNGTNNNFNISINREYVVNSSVVDNNYPEFGSFSEKPIDPAQYLDGGSYQFNTTINNSNGSAYIEFNNINYSLSNISDNFYFDISDLEVGVYNYYYWGYGNGTSNLFNRSIDLTYTVEQNNTYVLNITGTTPITYGTNGNFEGIGCPSQLICNLYRNGTLVSNPDTSLLGAGTYQYIYNTTGNINYSSKSVSKNLTINKANPEGSISGTSPITFGTNANIEGVETNTGDSDVTYNLYRDGVLVSNPDTSLLGAGTYTYVYNTTGGQNYSSNSSLDTFELVINKADNLVTITINPSETVTYGTETTTSCSVTAGTPNLYRDDILVSNPEVITLSAKNYTYICNTTGNQNYTSASNTSNLTISKATPTGAISGTSPITFGTNANVEGVETNTGDSDVTYNLYRDGVLVSNPDTSILGAGTYTYVYNTTGGENYTSVSSLDNFGLIVNKATPVLTYKLNGVTDNLTIVNPQKVNSSASTTGGILIVKRNGTDVTSENNQDIVLPIGYYEYNYTVLENENFTGIESKYLYVDVNEAIPIIEFVSPTKANDTTLEVETNYIEVNVTGDVLGDSPNWNITTYLYDENKVLINSTLSNSSPHFTNFTGLSKGIYYYNAKIKDEFNHSNTTELRKIKLINWTSYLGIDVDVPDTVFASSLPVLAETFKFNTSNSNTFFGVLTSMQIEKITGATPSDIYVVVDVDTIEIVNELVRTVDKDQPGVAGIPPFGFNVSNGEHTLNIYYYRTGNGGINISNVDFSLGRFETNDGFYGRGNLTNFTTSFSSTTPIEIYSKIINRTNASKTFINILTKVSSNDEQNIFCRVKDGGNSSWMGVTVPGGNEVRSMQTPYVTDFKELETNISVECYSSLGTSVTVEGTFIEADMQDFFGNPIQNNFATNNLTNITNTIILSAGENIITSGSFILKNGTSPLLSGSATVSSNTGTQEPTFMTIVTDNLGNKVCESNKTRHTSGDIGNTFFNVVCENLTLGANYTAWLNVTVPAGEELTLYDESGVFFENYPFDITVINTPPVISIISPLNGSNIFGLTYINWSIADSQPEDTHLTNITLYNSTHTFPLVINASDNVTSYLLNTSQYNSGTYYILASTVENNTDDKFNSNDTIQVNILNDAPIIVTSESIPNGSQFNINNTYYFNATITSTTTLDNINATFEGELMTILNISDNYYFNRTELSVGTYEICWNANNTLGLNTEECYNYSIVQNTSTCNIFFNETSPLSYNATFRAYTDCTSNFNLYRDGELIVNNEVQYLVPGTYNFTVNRTDTQNYSNVYDSELFTINKANPEGSITGTSPKTYGENANIEGVETNTGDSDVTYNLYRDGVLVSNPDTSILAVGTYTYVYNTTGGQNYSSNSSLDTFELVINKAEGNINLLLNGTDGNITVQYPNQVNASASSNTNQVIRLYQDGLNITLINGQYQLLNVSYYNFTAVALENQNYTQVSKTYFANVIKGENNANLTILPSTSVIYGNETNVSCSVDYGVANLYRNDVLVSNPDIQTLDVGSYNYTCNTSGTNNYLPVSESEILTVSTNVSKKTLYLNYNMTEWDEFPDEICFSFSNGGQLCFNASGIIT